MKAINQKIEGQLELAISLIIDEGCPSLRNRSLEKMANLGSFFVLSTVLDGFVYTTAEDQNLQDEKLDKLAEFMAFVVDSGLTETGLRKAYMDAFKYSKSRGFREKTIDQQRVDALKASGESEADIRRALAVENESAQIKLEAMKEILESNESFIQQRLIEHFNRSIAHATPTLANLPTWFVKSLANKIDSTVEGHRKFLRNGVIKGITTSGGDLYTINNDILPKLNTSVIIDGCLELEAETNEPGADDDGWSW